LKGATLIGELIAFLFLIVLGYFMGGLIIYTHGLSTTLGLHINYNLTIEPTSIPIKHEVALLSFLESTHAVSGEEIPMKKLIVASLVQNSSNVYINGHFIHVDTAAQDILDAWSTDKGFLLRIRKSDGDIRLAWNIVNFKEGTSVLRLQKISAAIVSPFKDGVLELIVR
jgi:hypothetical protein